MVKKGDTLVEVALAIGIFSMVAISIASVISSSTSGAQLSLETTLAREEVDTQAETIRFIHNAYASGKENSDQPLFQLWQKITKNAVQNNDINEDITKYTPQTCSELYDKDSPTYDYAFVINPRALNKGEEAYISLKDNKDNILEQASTYPRLIFGTSTKNDDNSELQNINNYPELYKAEGIYVIAVKDPGSTNIVSAEGQSQNLSAYYDFYIRTCWYGTGNNEPSTISTVIRLNDTSVVSTSRKGSTASNPTEDTSSDSTDTQQSDEYGYTIYYNANGGSSSLSSTTCNPSKCTVSDEKPSRDGYNFVGWCKNSPSCSESEKISPGATVDENDFSKNGILTLYAVWKETSETITVKLKFPSGDCDAHVEGQKSDGSTFHAYYGDKTISDNDGSILARLDHDYQNGGTETFTINVHGVRDYYYYVIDRRDRGECDIYDATVTVSDNSGDVKYSPDSKYITEDRVYFYKKASVGIYYDLPSWHVFAYKDGEITTGW